MNVYRIARAVWQLLFVLGFIWILESLKLMSDNTSTTTMLVYSAGELKAVGAHCISQICDCESDSASFLKDIPAYLKIPCVCSLQRSVTRKRRKRGGLRQKIRPRRFKLALPTVMYGNIRTLKNKIDELTSCTKRISEYRNACAIVLTESWLDESIPDSCVSLDNHILVRADRSVEQTGKTRGGGICIYINNGWCTNYTVKHTLCSPHLELLVVQCRPFYLPRDICCIAFVVVYIPPSADKRKAEEDVASVITELETSKPDAGIIVLGDFNGSSLQTVLPRYKQYVNFPSREENCLDLCYCNLHQAYQANKRPLLVAQTTA